MKKSQLTLYIFVSLVLGVLVGWIFPDFAVKLKPFADMFIRMIKMIVAPLVFATLVVGIAGQSKGKGFGRIGLKTIVYFEIVTTIALLIGLFIAHWIKPGAGLALPASQSGIQELMKLQTPESSMSLVETLVHMVPTSIFDAMSKGDILQVVIFALFFAFALGRIGDKGRPFLIALSSLAEIMFKFTEYVMFFAPMGVFAAIASTIGKNGIGVLGLYTKVIFALYFAIAIFVVTVLLASCKIIRVPFLGLMKALYEPILLAFSTASSEAALPHAMEILEKFGVPNRIVSFVMPIGYTFNLTGSTLYLSLATLFVAQLSNIHLSIGQQIMIMLTLMLTSKGVAAVPRVSLVILTGTLITFKLPIAGVALLLGIDQILDMGRTTINLVGNCVASAVIARWENCFDDNKMHRYLSGAEEEDILHEIQPDFGEVQEGATNPLSLKSHSKEVLSDIKDDSLLS